MKKIKNISKLKKNIEDLKNKNISLDEYKQKVENLEYQLKNKNISLHEYNQKIQKLKKEIKEDQEYFNSEEELKHKKKLID